MIQWICCLAVAVVSVPAFSQPATQSSEVVELRKIISEMREQIIQLKAENVALRTKLKSLPLASTSPATSQASEVLSFEDIARRKIERNKQSQVRYSRADEQRLIDDAKKIDTAVNAYLAKHPTLSGEVRDYIRGGKLKPGVPYDAALLYGSGSLISESKGEQHYGYTFRGDNYYVYDVYVRDGVIEEVSLRPD